MHRTYKEARRVLVLDAHLEEASCTNSSDVENLMRIYCSGWMDRLWTYEECVMAKDGALYVQFADGVVPLNFADLEAISNSHEQEWGCLYKGIITKDFLYYFMSLRSFLWLLPKNYDERRRIGTIWMTIRGRSTTKPGDEPIVLAALLGLDAGEIHKTPVQDRMRKLLSLKAEWPRDFLFADGPRLRAPGYQWAPSSFLRTHNAVAAEPDSALNMGVRTDVGLIITSPGFVLLGSSAPVMTLPSLFLDVQSNHWYVISHNDDDLNDPPDIPAWSLISPRKGIRSGLLIAERKRFDRPGKWALLVTINKEEDGILYVSFGCRMLISNAADPRLIGLAERNAPWARAEKEREQGTARGEFMPMEKAIQLFGRMEMRTEEQMWCVG
jgi:hypothetical protein